MKRIRLLVSVMMKASGDVLGSKKTSKSINKSKKAMLLLYIFLGIYIIGIVGTMGYLIINSMNKIGEPEIAYKALFLYLNGFTFITALIVTPSVLYFSKDIESYLVLPLEAWEILTAKFITSLVFLWCVSFIAFIPFSAVYYFLVGFNFIHFLMVIFIAFLFPIFSSALVNIVIILIFTFIPKVRNKDLFTYFTLIISVIVSLSFSFTTKFESLSPNGILDIINGSNNSMIRLLNGPLNPTSYYFDSLNTINPLPILIGVLITSISLIILMFVGQKYYLVGALNSQESISKKIALDDSKTINKKSLPQALAFAKIDLLNILRTPMLLTNYYFGLILIPILIFVPMIVEGNITSVSDTIEIIRQIKGMIPVSDFNLYLILGSFIFGFALSSFSSIQSTSFTREGSMLKAYLSMPMQLTTIYHSKLILSITTLGFFNLIYVLIIIWILNLSFLQSITSLLLVLLATICCSIIQTVFDIIAPKLVWDTEQEAIKQNFVSAAAMLVCMGLSGLSIYVTIKLEVYLAILLIVLGYSLISIIVYYLSLKLLGFKLTKNIENL